MAGASAWPRTRGVGAVVRAGALPVGCHGKAQTSEAALPPADAPADLLAEGTIATPDASWTRLQRGMGGTAGILPATIGGLICAASALDARLAAEISGTSPAYLVVAGSGASPSWVLAARLVEERRARPLFEGKGALFQTQDAGAGVVVIAGTRPTQTNAVVGIAPGGWLVVGRSAGRARGAVAVRDAHVAVEGADRRRGGGRIDRHRSPRDGAEGVARFGGGRRVEPRAKSDARR